MNHQRQIVMGLAIVLLAGSLAGCTQTSNNPTGAIKTSCGAAKAVSQASLDLPLSEGASPTLAPAPAAVEEQGSSQLVIGTFVSITGSLAAYGPDSQKGAELAVDEINKAGGVNGQPVKLVHEDDKTDATQAPQGFQNLVNQKVVGIVGAFASSVTGAILDGAKTSGVMVVTPASTSPKLTLERENGGYFLRVPPSDALQGKVLANVVFQDGCKTVTVVEVNNAYGVGLGTVFAQTFQSLGGTVQSTLKFEEKAQSFSTEVQRASSDGSDAVVFVGYPGEGAPFMKEAYQKGVMSKSVFFFTEGVKAPDFVTNTGKTSAGKFVLSSLRGTAPGAVTTPQFAHFNDSFSTKFGHAPGLFAAESYDATWMMALAATCGAASTGQAIKDNILKVGNKDSPADVGVSGANPTVALTSAKAPGCTVNYQGAAHDFNYDSRGDPADGLYTVWQVQEDGTIRDIRTDVRP